jgi:hypothetical protein
MPPFVLASQILRCDHRDIFGMGEQVFYIQAAAYKHLIL